MPIGTVWYRRFGDIPGIAYAAPEEIDRAVLPGHDATPRLSRGRLLDGREINRLIWDTASSDELDVEITGRSPAQDYAFAPDQEEVESDVLRTRLWESLELPGEPDDYHFTIQSVAGALWRRRVSEPDVLRWCEYLYLLDVRLIEACPEAIRNEFAEDDSSQDPYYHATAFGSLISLYEREGFLAEALDIAAIAARYGQGQERVPALTERLDAVRAEDSV